MKIFVVDCKGVPCLPTKPRRARQLLNQGRAVVKQVVPFTIQLKKSIENPVGDFEMGVDDGSKYVGIAIKNVKTNEIIFRGQLNHRQDVSKKVEERRHYRSARRYKLRCRKPRFNNRTKKDKLAPSIRQRKEAVLRVIKDMKKRLNIIKVTVEEVFFNHALYNYGKFFSLVEIGKKYLQNEIKSMNIIYECTKGFITKLSRITLGLSKKHSNDACAILNSNEINCREYFIKPRRSKEWLLNPTKIGSERNGFKHYDLIKATHRVRGFVVGSIRSLKANCITLRIKNNDNFPVSYKNSKLLQRFKGLIYSY